MKLALPFSRIRILEDLGSYMDMVKGGWLGGGGPLWGGGGVSYAGWWNVGGGGG